MTKKSRFSLANLQKQTIRNVAVAWEGITDTARAITGNIDPDVTDKDKDRLREKIDQCLNCRGGEVTARRNTINLGHTYLKLSAKGKVKFLKILASEFDVDRDSLKNLAEQYVVEEDIEAKIDLETKIKEILESARVNILRQFTGLPEGVQFLVNLRADALKHAKKDKKIAALSRDIKFLLANWFDVGLLDLKRITWESSAALLEKLIAYEAVHEIRSWDDLKNRLDSDRRCFAFFHHKMASEPLIFVEVALVNGISDNIHDLLDQDAPQIDNNEADTAIFYSISNTQKGLVGISLGNFLIKRVVDRLLEENSNLKNFATLSPVPMFTKWLNPLLEAGDESILLDSEKELLRKIRQEGNAANILHDMLSGQWHEDTRLKETLKPILLRLCANYILKEKRKGKAFDPVANFHLSNGASVYRLNWTADMSNNGLKQSYGIMVNYRYKLTQIDNNHETYLRGNVIPSSKTAKSVL
jgi:malonyl-CoA decarboxylase